MQLPDPEWPYICYTRHPYPEVQKWCEVNIGEFDQTWYKLGEDIMAMSMNPSTYKSTYMFRREADAIMFKLRWA
jgi:hypothetical protein